MRSHLITTRLVTVGCLTVAAVLGTASVASAEPAQSTTAVRSSAASTVAPVNRVHWGPKDLIGGSGVLGATVTLTDAAGKTRSTVVQSGNWFFVPAEGLTPTYSITQSIGGRTSAPVTFGTPSDVDIPAVSQISDGPSGMVTGLGVANAEIRIEGADGQVVTATANVTGRWIAYPVGFERGLSITQKSRGHWSDPVVFN